MMNTEDKAVKTFTRTDSWGMTHARWDYRGVTMHYDDTPTRNKPWSFRYDTQADHGYRKARTKAELMRMIDLVIDEDGADVDQQGRVLFYYS